MLRRASLAQLSILVAVVNACGSTSSTNANGPLDASLEGSTSTGSDASSDASSPGISVPVNEAGVVSVNTIASALFFTCVLPPAQTMECWGYNMYGMLGDGTTDDSLTPVEVSNLTGALAMGASGYNACAILPQHTVDCWGDNFSGQLGASTPANSDVPLEVLNVSNAVEISIGTDFACALRSNGSVACWGFNNSDELGNGTSGGVAVPPHDVVGLTTAVAISAGANHACALLLDGSVQCWGDNQAGELGIALSTVRSSVPVAAAGLTDVKAVSAGNSSTCALLTDGTISCWGDNQYGQLGDGMTTPSPYAVPTPVKVSGVSGATAVSVGNAYACAILADHSAACWGSNMEGILGNGTMNDSASPVPVSNLTNVVEIATGSEHTCARLADGSFACWGNNLKGQLGDQTMNQALTPVAVKL